MAQFELPEPPDVIHFKYGSVPIGAAGQKLWTIQHIIEAFVEELKPYNFACFWDAIVTEKAKFHKYIGPTFETVS